MMKQFYQLVSKLFARTLLKRESLLLPSGDLQILTSILQNTTLTTFRSNEQLEKIVNTHNIDSFEKIEDRWNTSIVIINGAPWSCDQDLASQLEDYINGQKEDQKGTAGDARG